MQKQFLVPSIESASLLWKPFQEHFPRPDKFSQDWLLNQGSLTRTLIRVSENRFKVVVVDERWCQSRSPYLLKVLGPCLSHQRMWSRKVVLFGNDTPWVMAHTLVPHSSLDRTGLGRVRKLNNRPLGEFLFNHPELERSRFDVTRTNTGWGRCSVFKLFHKPILVAEFFLPELVLKM